MKIAANLSLLFTELPLLQRVAAAAEAGFDGVEIQFPYELPASELQAALEAAQMPLVLLDLPAGDWISPRRYRPCGRRAMTAGWALSTGRMRGAPRLDWAGWRSGSVIDPPIRRASIRP